MDHIRIFFKGTLSIGEVLRTIIIETLKHIFAASLNSSTGGKKSPGPAKKNPPTNVLKMSRERTINTLEMISNMKKYYKSIFVLNLLFLLFTLYIMFKLHIFSNFYFFLKSDRGGGWLIALGGGGG